jgi:SAM-dependent methyltransferase
VESHETANRDRWDRTSDEYQASHGRVILAQPAAWGMWRIPEAELGVLPDVAGLDVLELGCGAAPWTEWLAGRGARATGLDFSTVQLAHARRRLGERGVRAALACGSAEALPFGDRRFDLVVSDHGGMSWGNPDRTLPEAARVLRPGGLLVVCATSPLFRVCWDEQADAPGDRLLRDYFGLHAVPEGEGAVTFVLTHAEWVRRFRAHGLTVEALREPRAPEGAVSTFHGEAGSRWARRWPAETIWTVRRV